MHALRKKNEKKKCTKKPPYKPLGLYRGENKRKIYINRMSDYCILNASLRESPTAAACRFLRLSISFC